MKVSRPEGEHSLAVFIDFENVGLGFGGRRDRFEIQKVLERIVEKGKIVAKKAYADWSRFSEYTRSLHEAAIELVEIPRRAQTGKNSADIRLVVDAIDLAYSKDHIDTFVIVSGDSDFSPLVSKLKELGKHVIGLGLADATSVLLRDNCDEFIYYEDLGRAPATPIPANEAMPDQKRKVFVLLMEALLALRRENKEILFASMVKDTMKRKKPSFNEGYYGYRTFTELLEDARKEGLLELDKHRGSGMLIVTRFGSELKNGPSPNGLTGAEKPSEKHAEEKDPQPGRRRRGSGRGRAEPGPVKPEAARAETTPADTKKSAPTSPPIDDDAYDSHPERPLGRDLMAELDEEPLLDEVPSYRPRKPAAPPAAKAPSGPPAEAEVPSPPRLPARPAGPKAPAAKKPERAKPPADKPPPAPSARPANPPAQPAGKAPARRPSPPARSALVEAPKTADQPQPKPVDEGEEFGAGLDV